MNDKQRDLAAVLLAKKLSESFKEYCDKQGGKTTDPTLFRTYMFSALAMVYLCIDELNHPTDYKTSDRVSFSSCEEDMC